MTQVFFRSQKACREITIIIRKQELRRCSPSKMLLSTIFMSLMFKLPKHSMKSTTWLAISNHKTMIKACLRQKLMKWMRRNIIIVTNRLSLNLKTRRNSKKLRQLMRRKKKHRKCLLKLCSLNRTSSWWIIRRNTSLILKVFQRESMKRREPWRKKLKLPKMRAELRLP